MKKYDIFTLRMYHTSDKGGRQKTWIGCNILILKAYLIFVTGITGGACGEIFCYVEKFLHMKDCHVEKYEENL